MIFYRIVNKQRILGSITILSLLAILSYVVIAPSPLTGGTRAAESAERQRFRAQLRSTSRTVPVPPGRCNDDPGRPQVVGLVEVQGAGDVDILGQIFEEQSHCLRADGSFFNGVYRFVNRNNAVIEGRYFGTSIPTFNTKFSSNAPPSGPFLIEGNVCISGGNFGRIEDDCRAGRYFPARGFLDLSSDGTGDASIFIDQTIGIDRDRDR